MSRLKIRRTRAFFILLFPIFFLSSCATYQSKVSGARALLKNGQVTEALQKFKELAEVDDRDQLVHRMDYAMALQIAGFYKDSAEEFLRADKLIDLNDYHSVTNIVGATLGGEEMVQYKGESYEKFLINTMNAINYLMLGRYDDAMVEARRINEKISKMKMDGREPYELSPLARYLAAVLWESQKQYDDAYIEYEGAYKLDGQNPLLPADLLRSSKLARRDQAYQKWKNEFPNLKENPAWYDKNKGELIVIFQQGWGPEKHARQQYRFPELWPVRSQTQFAQVSVDGKKENTRIIYDVQKVAMTTLEKDFGALVARRVGGIAAKAVVADQFRQKNELVGQLAWIAMNLSDRADLRHWSTLPQTIQLVRISLPPGKYKVSLQGLDFSGNPTPDVLEGQEIRIQAGRKSFMNWRALR